MKLSELKNGELRNVLILNINDEIKEINIYNLKEEDREILLNKMKEMANNEKKDSEIAEELYTDILMYCTDLEVDEPIVETLSNPSGDLLYLMRDVMDIFNELQMELLLNQYNTLNELEKLNYSQLMVLKSQKIDMITKKSKQIQNEIDELKKGD